MGKIPDSGIILICISGAGFGVLLGYAIFRFFMDPTAGIKDFPQEQKDYMREVRRRNKGWNYFEAAAADKQSNRYTESTVDY